MLVMLKCYLQKLSKYLLKIRVIKHCYKENKLIYFYNNSEIIIFLIFLNSFIYKDFNLDFIINNEENCCFYIML